MAVKKVKSIPASKVKIFKIKNRQGYAALCERNLTEGRTPLQAFQRMVKAVKRDGFALNGTPRVR